jgi:hypothetical protein
VKEGKQSFFEKKDQKTFAYGVAAPRLAGGQRGDKIAKVFWFFFSKKNCLPSEGPP